ncbi:MAG: sulfotransferase family protein, partial [Anaerolineales bacterium]
MSSNIKRICLWSGPRNISTALMYSFAQRDDCT